MRLPASGCVIEQQVAWWKRLKPFIEGDIRLMWIVTLALVASLCAPEVCPATAGADTPNHSASDSLRATFEKGQTWTDFYAAVDRRREVWERAWISTQIPESLAARARAAGKFRLLVITEYGCSDSANSVPVLARIAEAAPNIEMRLVKSATGRPWMEKYRTPDGRAATPTVLVLDDEFRIRSAWVEQPKELQAFWLPIIASKETGARFGEKAAWYTKDEGREIMRELVETIEAAVPRTINASLRDR